MKPGQCYRGGTDQASLDRAVVDGALHPGDADEIATFAEYLRLSAEHGPAIEHCRLQWPPNLLRQWRAYLGLDHTTIDRYESNLWAAEVARPETEAGR